MYEPVTFLLERLAQAAYRLSCFAILDKSLNRGESANVAAILMGQAALLEPRIYGEAPVSDLDGNRHAAIRFSTVVLAASGPSQLATFVQRMRSERPALICLLFSKGGQTLHNAYDQYCSLVASASTDALVPVGSLVVGDDPEVREATKKFSLLR